MQTGVAISSCEVEISPCAASTVESFTGPIAARSSSSISAARWDRFERNFTRTSWLAPFRATVSFELSISRSSVCRSRSAIFFRSSNVKSRARSSAASGALSRSISAMTSLCCCSGQRRSTSSAIALPHCISVRNAPARASAS